MSVEDAQGLDRPTTDALAFVGRRIESDPSSGERTAGGGAYLFGASSGLYQPAVIDVLTLDGDKTAAVTAFLLDDANAAEAFASFASFASFGRSAELSRQRYRVYGRMTLRQRVTQLRS
jgi:hypothetical protein